VRHACHATLDQHTNDGLARTVAHTFTIGLSRADKLDRSVRVSGTDVILDIAGYVV
jgi:hypothetical protein